MPELLEKGTAETATNWLLAAEGLLNARLSEHVEKAAAAYERAEEGTPQLKAMTIRRHAGSFAEDLAAVGILGAAFEHMRNLIEDQDRIKPHEEAAFRARVGEFAFAGAVRQALIDEQGVDPLAAQLGLIVNAPLEWQSFLDTRNKTFPPSI